jgi:mxaJ protein
MVFDISMGVRREDDAFQREIDAAMVRKRDEIDAILAEYDVPRLDARRQRAERAP